MAVVGRLSFEFELVFEVAFCLSSWVKHLELLLKFILYWCRLRVHESWQPSDGNRSLYFASLLQVIGKLFFVWIKCRPKHLLRQRLDCDSSFQTAFLFWRCVTLDYNLISRSFEFSLVLLPKRGYQTRAYVCWRAIWASCCLMFASCHWDLRWFDWNWGRAIIIEHLVSSCFSHIIFRELWLFYVLATQ